MRVLHVTSGMDPHDGGAAFALAGLAPALQNAGLDIHVATTFRDGDDVAMCDELKSAGVETTRIGPVYGPLGMHVDIAPTLDRLVYQADVVHIHAMWEQVQHLAARSAKRHGRPYIMRPCGMLTPWALAQSRWKKKMIMALRVRRHLTRAAAVHFTSEAERDLTALVNLPTPTIVVPNGINTAHLLEAVPETQHLRACYPGLPEGPLLLFFSRIHPKKGPDLLIDAFIDVLARWNPQANGPPPGLVIAGPDEADTRAGLEKRVEQAGISNLVVFTGLLTGTRKAAALQTADLFCLPSHQENFGIAVVEALAAGTPVVISDQVNIHQAITDAGVGEVVQLHVPALAEVLGRWLRDPALRALAAENASRWACMTYSWPQIAKRWSDILYPSLLKQ